MREMMIDFFIQGYNSLAKARKTLAGAVIPCGLALFLGLSSCGGDQLDIPDQPDLGLLGLNYLENFRMDVRTEEGLLLLEPR